MIQANTNYYNVDPFDNPVWPEVEPTPEPTLPKLPGADECNPCTPSCYDEAGCEEWRSEHIKLYPDHVWLNTTETGELTFMRTEYFN